MRQRRSDRVRWAERAQELAALFFLTIAFVAELWVQTWSERAAIGFAIGALGLIASLPRLRDDEESSRALLAALVAIAFLVASAIIAAYVVRSWHWLTFSLLILVGLLLAEGWERYGEALWSDVDRDIEERQERQTEQLQKIYPRL